MSPPRVAAVLATVVVTMVGLVPASPASQAVQEMRAGVFVDSLRVDSLREGVTPTRLEELRRRAAEEGTANGWYDLGTALLLSGDWEGAVEPLERVVMAGGGDVDPSAAYNLGVAHGIGGRPGERALAPGVDTPAAAARRDALVRARDAFRRVLRADPAASDARWNLEVVNRWLARLGGAGGGGGDGGGGAGQRGPEGEPRELTPEEVQRLLEAAASEERRVQEERFERSRARDPVAERNW